ncbi:MAG TPA: MMPL family transporter [Solirubrobacteraceae bacterium]
MTLARFLSGISDRAARRPVLALALALSVGIGCAVAALGLHPSAATDTFVGRSNSTFKSTQRFYRNFGEEPIAVLVKGDLQQLLLSSDLERLVGLEGCLSGNVPTKALAVEGGAQGPCGKLARSKTVKVVLGPGTFINEAAEVINAQLASQRSQAAAAASEARKVFTQQALAHHRSTAEAHQLGEEASKITIARFAEGVTMLALQYGLNSPPSLTNPNFITRVVFDSTKPAGTPKEHFAYLFPSRDSALISVRLKDGLSESKRAETISLIASALKMPQWHLQHGGRYLLTGEPVIVSQLAGSITRSLKLLLIAVVLVMALALALIFWGRPRLLPLGIALLAAALTFGLLALLGASLTVASIAVLPILIGLAVDYTIQFQSRVGEALEDASSTPLQAVRSAVLAGVPAIATAAVASAAAMLVLLLSPVPMVRGFAGLLVAGIAIALLCALSAGSAVLVLSARRRAGSIPAGTQATRAWRLDGPLAEAWRGARELLSDNPLNRYVNRVALMGAARNPGRVLLIGTALAAIGWGLDTQTKVQTDITKLVPQNLSSLRALNELERASGVGGEIDLMISGRDLAKPAVISWMSSYQQSVLKHFHYSSARGCGRAELCPAFSLPDLLGSATASSVTNAPETSLGSNGSGGTAAHATTKSNGASAAAGAHPASLTPAEIRALLATIPSYFSQDVITANRRFATLAFGIRLMPLSEQQHVIEAMRSVLHPPAGVSAQLVGLPVLAAQSEAQIASVPQRLLSLLAGLAAVALVLLAAFRGDRTRVLAAMLPVALASGWSALVLFAVRVPLNPMSVTLGALVIAISTEFSVLLCERHRQERLAGHSSMQALRRSYQRTGRAVVASGITAIAGFGVLALSDIRMLRDFGLLTLIDLSVSLIGVLVVLPSVLELAERGDLERPLRSLAQAFSRPRTRVAGPGSGRAPHEPA